MLGRPTAVSTGDVGPLNHKDLWWFTETPSWPSFGQMTVDQGDLWN